MNLIGKGIYATDGHSAIEAVQYFHNSGIATNRLNERIGAHGVYYVNPDNLLKFCSLETSSVFGVQLIDTDYRDDRNDNHIEPPINAADYDEFDYAYA